MEGQAVRQDLFHRKGELIQIFIAKQMAIFLIDASEIPNVNQKDLETIRDMYGLDYKFDWE
jgi:hypothetical protein